MEAILSRAIYPANRSHEGCDTIEIETNCFVAAALDFGNSATTNTQAAFDALLALFSRSLKTSQEEPLYSGAPTVIRACLELSEEELARLVVLFDGETAHPRRLVA